MDKWEIANKCPHCGGRMTASEYFSLTHDYIIKKDGNLSKRYTKSEEGSIDCITVRCNSCMSYWDSDNTVVTNNGVYIRGNGEGGQWKE